MRREFSKAIKRDALARSGMLCEAEGALYGLKPNQRCNAPLGYGVAFDHILADSNGGEPTLDNCCATCLPCHGFKTRHFDTPRAAKIKRQSDAHLGIRKAPSFQKPSGYKYDWKTGRYERAES